MSNRFKNAKNGFFVKNYLLPQNRDLFVTCPPIPWRSHSYNAMRGGGGIIELMLPTMYGGNGCCRCTNCETRPVMYIIWTLHLLKKVTSELRLGEIEVFRVRSILFGGVSALKNLFFWRRPAGGGFFWNCSQPIQVHQLI